MTGKTGAARIALTTGAPVIPVAQWGAQEVIGPYRKEFRILPRKVMRVTAGPPVDLDDLRGRDLDAKTLREATERIVAAITALLEEIRGETAPAERFDLRASRAAAALETGTDSEGTQD
jgi:1-acyl-sn-glycerol-3-phosphate acyltransferase